MLPSHIVAEIAERTQTASPAQLLDLAHAVGIDPEPALAPRPTVEEVAAFLHPIDPQGELYVGGIEFDLKVEALGVAVTRRCRVVYKTALADDEDRRTGEPIRICGSAQMAYQFLRWEDPEETDDETRLPVRRSAPTWEMVDLYPLLPKAAELRLDDLIEEQALHQEALRLKSNP